jgi:antitoxin HicB
VSYRTRQRNRQKGQHRERASPEPPRPENSIDLPYPVTLLQDTDGKGDWVATIDALAGCTGRGDTPQEALDAVSAAAKVWRESAEREGREVPEPKSVQSHSGRLLLRMPQTLHAELSRVAERESVSLNQFITDVLAGSLGWRVPARVGRIATRLVHDPSASANGDGEGEPAGSPALPSAQPERRSARFVSAALLVNFVVVAVVAVVAIVVLIATWW